MRRVRGCHVRGGRSRPSSSKRSSTTARSVGARWPRALALATGALVLLPTLGPTTARTQRAPSPPTPARARTDRRRCRQGARCRARCRCHLYRAPLQSQRSRARCEGPSPNRRRPPFIALPVSVPRPRARFWRAWRMAAVLMIAATTTPVATAAVPAAAVVTEGASRFHLLVFEGAQVQTQALGTMRHVAAPSPHPEIDAPPPVRGFSGSPKRRAMGSPPLKMAALPKSRARRRPRWRAPGRAPYLYIAAGVCLALGGLFAARAHLGFLAPRIVRTRTAAARTRPPAFACRKAHREKPPQDAAHCALLRRCV